MAYSYQARSQIPLWHDQSHHLRAGLLRAALQVVHKSWSIILKNIYKEVQVVQIPSTVDTTTVDTIANLS